LASPNTKTTALSSPKHKDDDIGKPKHKDDGIVNPKHKNHGIVKLKMQRRQQTISLYIWSNFSVNGNKLNMHICKDILWHKCLTSVPMKSYFIKVTLEKVH
jgi:hypothetical protein